MLVTNVVTLGEGMGGTLPNDNPHQIRARLKIIVDLLHVVPRRTYLSTPTRTSVLTADARHTLWLSALRTNVWCATDVGNWATSLMTALSVRETRLRVAKEGKRLVYTF